MTEKVTRRGFFGWIGVLTGVATVAPLVAKAEAPVMPTRRYKHVEWPHGFVVNDANFAKKLWPDVKRWWDAAYDDMRSTEQ